MYSYLHTSIEIHNFSEFRKDRLSPMHTCIIFGKIAFEIS